MKRRVLVIGGGNHHNALGVIRALGERGYDVELITIGDLKSIIYLQVDTLLPIGLLRI